MYLPIMPYPPINTEISSPRHPPYYSIFWRLHTPPFANGGNQTMLKLLLYLSFKAELPLRYFFLGLKIYWDMKKLLSGHQAILAYLGLKFPQFQPQNGNFLLYSYSKVTALTNYELRTLNCELKVICQLRVLLVM